MARGSARVSVSHNIADVVSDLDDVKDSLRKEVRRRVGAAMRVLWADVRQYVLDDPHASGDLFSAIKQDMTEDSAQLEFSVYTDSSIAPYAAITEFGSGARTATAWQAGNGVPGGWPATGSAVPVGYPYESPDIQNLSGFAFFIEKWMRAKGLIPELGSYRASSLAIAKKIDERGTYAHPYLRPAWFDNERLVKRAARNAVKNAVR